MVNYQDVGEKQKGFLAGTKYPKITEYLKLLGEEGWELVSAWYVPSVPHIDSHYGAYEYVLKRPKQDIGSKQPE